VIDADSKSGSLIQLSAEIQKTVNRQMKVCQKACPGKLHPLDSRNTWKLNLPRKFREQRALAISCWYFPDWLKWEILLEINQNHNFLHLNFNWVQEIELRCLVEKEEIMLRYLQEVINPRELFGTILQEDLLNALKLLNFSKEEKGPVVRRVRRKGYRDKGSWRPSHLWLPSSDFTFTEQQNKRELIQTFLISIFQLFLSKLGAT